MYLEIIADLSASKETKGEFDVRYGEYLSAVKNKTVGIGSCLAAGVALVRLPLRRLLSRFLHQVFILNSESVNICPACNQKICTGG